MLCRDNTNSVQNRKVYFVTKKKQNPVYIKPNLFRDIYSLPDTIMWSSN